ncbi:MULTISPECIES: DUF2878 domain-containing protein [Citrobacter]|uniref:DUF2878 domain-containing protein n=1 Tax=Citrobacter TaxID=544 RepID=UPI000C758C64|nr:MULTISPECIES: DUF2878 domain-containing protein [Citrobacter]ELN2652907.1 DUF2878 domain-containing protein [Citrobacter braakii]MBJ8972149.1 DUF2878 domain-containing protein [Citrobacter braakii]MCS8550848.1 DUF2878 domain-containing protein [Citrobacter sp. XY323]MDM3336817.1 DUF2878 domain-containing protein [Citrobacter sp. Cb043]MDM3386561.1 DUF2878 domain-containing protein [Citrobacter sp. Cb011]
MNRHLQVFILAVGFDLYWLMVVLLRERGLVLWLGLAILACFLLPPAQRLYALMLAAAGSSLDALWALTGLIDFHGEALLPLWMVALWLMFAALWTHLTCSTTLPGWLLAIMATGGGPVAYVIGERLGSITFLEPAFIVVGLMAAGWLVLMLFFHIFMGKRQ